MAKRRSNNHHRERVREPRINGRINAQKVRLVIGSGAPVVMTKEEALRKAGEQGLDLVEVSPDQDPPVCKIIDYGKYKYEQQKKKKDQVKNQHTVQIKEIKLRPKIAEHDYDLKKRNAISFLEKGDKVKVSLRFRGREIMHSELGMQLMRKMATDVAEVGTVETQAKMDGRQIIMVIASKVQAKKKPAASSNKKEGGPEGKPTDSSQKGVEQKESAESLTSSSAK